MLKNTNTEAINSNRHNKIITATRRLAIGLGLAVGLAACSQAAPQTNVAGPTETVLVDQTVLVGEPGDTERPAPADDVERVVVPATTPSTAPPAKPVKPVACAWDEFPETVYVEATSDLNVRQGPGTSNAAISHIPQGTLVEFAYFADNDGCVRIPGSGVWWAVWDNNLQTIGWSHASYLVNETYIPDFHGEETFDDNDVHLDCAIILDSPCAEVSRRSDGTIDQVFSTLSASEITTAQIDCVYNVNPEACDLLSALGYDGSTNFGLGNSLSMAPIDDIVAGCYGEIPSLGPVDLVCAELFFREGGSGH